MIGLHSVITLVSLTYIFLGDQIPKKATTREEAVTAIRLCDRLCSLLDNQPHCVKNDKFLIVATIEHVFTQVHYFLFIVFISSFYEHTL